MIKILFKIILSIVWLGASLFALAVLLYFGMLFYLGYKDGTIYQYQTFKCKNKVFTNNKPLNFYSKNDGRNIIDIEMYTETTSNTKKVYPIGNKFKFASLYSLYDFEGGTFYNYLIEDEKGIKSFISFSDINPKTCTLDINHQYSFRNIQEYYPKGEKTKISKATRNEVFKINKEKK